MGKLYLCTTMVIYYNIKLVTYCMRVFHCISLYAHVIRKSKYLVKWDKNS